jgi:hypothetical protein
VRGLRPTFCEKCLFLFLYSSFTYVPYRPVKVRILGRESVNGTRTVTNWLLLDPFSRPIFMGQKQSSEIKPRGILFEIHRKNRPLWYPENCVSGRCTLFVSEKVKIAFTFPQKVYPEYTTYRTHHTSHTAHT